MARKKGKKFRCLSGCTLSLPTSNRPKKLRQWDDDAMGRALEAVTEGKMSVNRAAVEYNVPRTTLKDRVSGRVIHGSNMGPKMYLTYEEEKELVDFLLNCARMGYAKTRQDVLKIVHNAMLKKGKKIDISWLVEPFLQEMATVKASQRRLLSYC